MSQEVLKRELDFAIMALSVFGLSTCYAKNISDSHSIDKLYRFLGLVPPPSLANAEIKSEDWRTLINGDFMESYGFVGENLKPIPPALQVSQSCLQMLQAVRSCNQRKNRQFRPFTLSLKCGTCRPGMRSQI